MNRTAKLISLTALVAVCCQSAALAQVTLTRLDCGTSTAPTDVGVRMSDTYAFSGLKVQLTFSCYLVRHGDDYMIWDTGQPMTAGASAPKTSLVDLLAQLKVTPDQIKYVGISHYHGDHTGQVGSFPRSTLLIGRGDWEVLNDPKATGVNAAAFSSWISGGGKVEPLTGDRDVFGDGSVVVLNIG